MKKISLFLLTLPLSTLATLAPLAIAVAQQVTSDGTVSTTVTTPDGKIFNIDDGTRRGGNLFHSFQEFSVPTGGSANFNNAADVLNIISRVTGGSVSNIDGLIRTLGKANLFLLNPAGIIFGPNASLQIGGSFLGSTANSFLFKDGFEFSATNPQAPPLLTINVPIGLGFRNNPQNITNQSRAVDTSGNPVGGLDVSSGNYITLVGGNVNLNGGILFAPGGRIELGGLSTAGTVGLNGDGSLSFPVGVQRADVSLTNRAIVAVQGAGGGNIAVNARNLDLSGGSLLFAGIETGLGTPGAQAGDIRIDATDKVKITGTTSSYSGIFNITSFGSNITEPGNAGNIVINTGTLEGNGYIVISSGTNGEGNAGKVLITAKDKVSLTGDANTFARVGTLVGSSGIGNGADIVIDTGSLSLSNASLDTSTLGQGNAGNIQIKASESISVTNNSQLAAGTSGKGNAGNIVIDAVDAAVSFDANSLVSTAVSSTSTGIGGDITIKARNLSANNGASLFSTTFRQVEAGRLANGGNIQVNVLQDISFKGGSYLSSETFGQGNAGNVTVSAGGNIYLEGGSYFSSGTFGQGNAGNVTVSAGGNISLEGGSYFSSGTFGQGNAGNVTVSAGGNISLEGGSYFSSGTFGQGNAGNVTVAAGGNISLDGRTNNGSRSGIFSYVATGAKGNGGNINISGQSVSLTNDAIVNTSSTGQGNAGNITVQAQDTISLVNSLITNNVGSVQRGPAKGNVGNIVLEAREVSLNNGAQLQAGLYSGAQGNPGIVSVKATDSISFVGTNSGIFTDVEFGAVGNGSDIQILAPSVSFKDNAILKASNAGQGNAGNILVRAQDTIFADNTSLILSNVGSNQKQPAKGNVGNIVLEAREISLNTKAQLQAGLFSGAQGNPGVVSVRATDSISFVGKDSGLFTDVESGAVGNGSDIQILAPSVSFKDDAVLKASNAGQGNGGNIAITADSVFFDNSLVLSRLENSGVGNAGNIEFRTGSLSVNNGTQLSTDSFGKGNAGNVRINATGSVTLNGVNNEGFSSAVFSSVNPGAIGNAGSIDINARSLSVSDRGKISTSNTGTGAAGNINITTAKDIRLDNQALISADTNGGQGNITLNSGDLILRHNSSITTNARNTADGGNININTGNLVALENSKITANAEQGYGGNIFITTTGGRFLSPDSVISATSEAGPQFNGIVQFNTQPNDPTRGLFELSEAVIDPAQQVAQNPCNKGFGSTFTITGRGGLPTDPQKVLSSDNVRVDLIQPVSRTVNSTSTTYKQRSQQPIVKKITPAQGWIYNEKGQVVLVGYDPTKTGVQREQPAPNSSCAAVK